MCGITGYIGNENAKNILIEALEKLEYRGYDSAGLALGNGRKISVLKAKGKIRNLKEKAEGFTEKSHIGIGHTRWATHGIPDDKNAHPHSSKDGVFSVVHNGIIENFSLLKEELIKKGHSFLSDTDSEVIAELLSYHYESDVLSAMSRVCLSLEGAFAIAVLCADFPDVIFAAKKMSPLAVGKGENENLIASDISAFGERAKEIAYLDENEIAVIKKDEIFFCDFNLNPIEKSFEISSQKNEDFSKGNFEHFMLKEIYEQPQKIEKLFENNTREDKFYFENIPNFFDAEKIYIVACGSAHHAALAGKIALEEMARIPTEALISSEFRYSNPILNKKTPVIVISQSGETADTIAAMKKAQVCGAETLAIVNVPTSTIAKESKFVIQTHAGREVAVATTKGYTTQVAVLYMLAIFISENRKTLPKNEIAFYTKEMKKIPEKMKKILSQNEEIKSVAEKFFDKKNFFFIGRNTDYAAATEGALKLREISYINAFSFPAGELKHGTIALIEEGTPVLAVNANPRLYKKTLSNIEEVFSRGAEIIMLSEKSSPDSEFETIKIPDCPELLLPLLEAVPLQLFAYYLSDKKGCDIDMPKNLAKSVTVE